MSSIIATGYRFRDGQRFTVNVYAPQPGHPTPAPVGKSQHGKRGGYREGSREKWQCRALAMATATAEGVR
jgi:hypothetical protein